MLLKDFPHDTLIDARRPDRTVPETFRARRASARGELSRLRRGVYTDSLTSLESIPRSERAAEAIRRYVNAVAAVALTRRRSAVFSFETALVLWGMPVLQVPSVVHITEPPSTGRSSVGNLRVHTAPLESSDVVPWGDCYVTSPLRTLTDVARSASLYASVAALDFALADSPELEKSTLIDALQAQGLRKGRAGARAAIEFADPRSGSPGESVSRVAMWLFGAPPPQLQVEHRSPLPGVQRFFTDFEWPEHGVIGEFDGLGKYVKPEYLRGRDAGEVVYDEKRREDALRAEGARVARWGWYEARRPWLIRHALATAGLPLPARSIPHRPAW